MTEEQRQRRKKRKSSHGDHQDDTLSRNLISTGDEITSASIQKHVQPLARTQSTVQHVNNFAPELPYPHYAIAQSSLQDWSNPSLHPAFLSSPFLRDVIPMSANPSPSPSAVLSMDVAGMDLAKMLRSSAENQMLLSTQHGLQSLLNNRQALVIPSREHDNDIRRVRGDNRNTARDDLASRPRTKGALKEGNDLKDFYASKKKESNPSSKRTTKLLFTNGDDENLSPYQCLIRKQIELFSANKEDVARRKDAYGKKIVLGQVGIQCCHCSEICTRYRTRGATYYPSGFHGLYQAAQNMAGIHLAEHCHLIPDQIREELATLRNKRGRSTCYGAGKEYWIEGAKMAGVVEKDGVLYFKEEL